MMIRTPQNGTKTHPLSNYATEELRAIAAAPRVRCSINPGVVNRLMRENLVEPVELPSPFKTHLGGNASYLQITDAGRETLAALGAV